MSSITRSLGFIELKRVFNDGRVVTVTFWKVPDLDLSLSPVALPFQDAASIVKDLSLHSASWRFRSSASLEASVNVLVKKIPAVARRAISVAMMRTVEINTELPFTL